MIIIESKRKKPATILKKYPDAIFQQHHNFYRCMEVSRKEQFA